MKADIIKSEIGEIKSVIHYSIIEGTPIRIQHLGDRSEFVNEDFAEYDFSYFIDKFKFNDISVLSNLDSYLVNYITGKSIEFTEVINNMIYPSSTKEESSSIYDYFGSVRLRGTDNFMNVIYSDEYINKVELYNEVLPDDFVPNDNTKPAIVINLGPEEGAIYDDDYEIALLNDEITCSKIIWTAFTFDNSQLKYNLSYGLWLSDKNSNRNKNLYSIRNDEYFSTVKNIKLVDKKEGHCDPDDELDPYFDHTSTTVVGTKNTNVSMEEYPLLSLIIPKQSSSFNPNISYKKGSEAVINDTTYVSLVDNNKGNLPYTSTNWTKLESKNFLTTNLDILTDPLNTANITPSRVSVNNDELNPSPVTKFNIIPIPGYEVDFNFDTPSNPLNNCISNGFDSEVIPDEIEISDNPNVKTFSLQLGTYRTPWSLFTNANSGKAIIRMKKAPTEFEFIIKNPDGGELSYEDWHTYIENENNFSIKKVVVDGNSVSIPSIENNYFPIYVNSGSDIEVSLGSLDRFEIDSIELSYHNGVSQLSREIEVIQDSNGGYSFRDSVDYLYAKYIFNISPMTYSIEVFGDLKYFEIEDKFIESDYKKPFFARFYCAANNPEEAFYGVLIYTASDNFSNPVGLYSIGQKAVVGTGENAINVELMYNPKDKVYTVKGDKTCENYRINIIKINRNANK